MAKVNMSIEETCEELEKNIWRFLDDKSKESVRILIEEYNNITIIRRNNNGKTNLQELIWRWCLNEDNITETEGFEQASKFLNDCMDLFFLTAAEQGYYWDDDEEVFFFHDVDEINSKIYVEYIIQEAYCDDCEIGVTTKLRAYSDDTYDLVSSGGCMSTGMGISKHTFNTLLNAYYEVHGEIPNAVYECGCSEFA